MLTTWGIKKKINKSSEINAGLRSTYFCSEAHESMKRRRSRSLAAAGVSRGRCAPASAEKSGSHTPCRDARCGPPWQWSSGGRCAAGACVLCVLWSAAAAEPLSLSFGTGSLPSGRALCLCARDSLVPLMTLSQRNVTAPI